MAAYLIHVADRFDLRRDIQLDTRVAGTSFDEDTRRRQVELEGGDRVTATYVVMGKPAPRYANT